MANPSGNSELIDHKEQDNVMASRQTAQRKGPLEKVTVKVHPANVDRLKALAREWEVDAASVSPALWQAALECAAGDEVIARQFLEARLMYMGGQRLVEIAASGPEGLARALDYLGQVASGVHV